MDSHNLRDLLHADAPVCPRRDMTVMILLPPHEPPPVLALRFHCDPMGGAARIAGCCTNSTNTRAYFELCGCCSIIVNLLSLHSRASRISGGRRTTGPRQRDTRRAAGSDLRCLRTPGLRNRTCWGQWRVPGRDHSHPAIFHKASHTHNCTGGQVGFWSCHHMDARTADAGNRCDAN